MAYLGRVPATGENNAFRILDDISSYVLTFDGSSANTVSLANDTIALSGANNRFITGQRVVYSKGAGGTIITGLAEGAHYVVRMSDTTIKLAPTANDALNQTNLRNFTGLGAGTAHKLTLAFDGINTKFKATYENGTQKPLITRAAQLVLSINGVIQQPVDSTTPSVGFGFDVSGVIIFSTAPSASDAFWGHVLASNTVTFDISDNNIDKFTGNGTTTEFNLSKIPPDNRNILVTIDGVVQYPSDNTITKAYGLSENKLQFTSAPANGADIQVRHIGFAGASGGGGGGVSSFYGRTGAVVLKNTDNPVIGNLTAVDAAFSGNVSIAKTLTYMDVTNIDSVGVSTFQDDVYFNGTGVGISSLTWDKSANSLDFKDGIKARFGDSQDLSIYHDGANTYQVNTTGSLVHRSTGEIFIQSDTGVRLTDVGNNETFLRCIDDGAVELYHGMGSGTASQKKLETTSTGISITGIPVATQTTGNVGLELHATGSGRGSQTKYHNDHGEAYVGTAGDTTGNLLIHNTSNTHMLFATNNTERLRITSDGRLWLGINSWSGHASCDDLIIGDGSGHRGLTVYSGSSNDGGIYFADGTSSNASYRGIIGYEHANDAMVFRTAALERLRITSAGKVGVNTTSPSYMLQVQTDGTSTTAGGNVVARFQSSGAAGRDATIQLSDNVANSATISMLSSALIFKQAGAETFRITPAGSVGINSTSPDRRFTLQQDATCRMNLKSLATSTAGIEFGDEADHNAGYIVYDNTDNSFQVGVNGTGEKLRLTSFGSLIVGNQTSTSYKLCVSEAAHTRAEIISTSNNSAGIWLKTFNSGSIVSQSTIRTSNDGNLELYAGTSSEMKRFWIDATNGTYLQGTSHTNFEVRSNSASTKAVIQTVQDSEVRIGATTDHPLALYAGTLERLRLPSTGGITVQQGNSNYPTTFVGGATNGRNYVSVKAGNTTSGHSSGVKLNHSDGNGVISMFINHNDDHGHIMNEHQGGDILFYTNESGSSLEKLRITSTGDLAIGGGPGSYDDITGAACGLVIGKSSFSNSGIMIRTGSSGTGRIYFGDNSGNDNGRKDGHILYNQTDRALVFGTAQNERVRITSTGRVGINETSPDKDLHIKGASSPGWKLEDTTNTCILQGYAQDSNACVGTYSNHDLWFATNSAERFRITNEGQLLHSANKSSGYTAKFNQTHADNPAWIEINSPNDNNLRPAYIQLQNNGTNKWGVGQVYSSTSSGAFHISVGAHSEANSKVTIDTAGRVFIGRVQQYASSSEKLSVNGMTSIQYASTSAAGLYIFNTESTTSGNPVQPFIFLHDGGGIRGGLGLQRSTSNFIINAQTDLQIRTGNSGVGGTEKVRINSAGQIKKVQDPVNRTALKTYSGEGLWVDHYQYQVSGTYQRYADIAAVGDGSWGSNLRFHTMPNGGSAAERFRITANGTAVFGGNSAAPIIDNGEMLYRGNSTKTFENLPQVLYLYSDDIAYNGTNSGAGIVFGGNYNSSSNYTTFAGIHGIKENNTDGNYSGALIFGVRPHGSGAPWERSRITGSGYMGIGESNPHTGLSISKFGTRQKADGNTYYQPHGNWCTVWNNGTSNNTDYWAGFIGGYDKSGCSVNISLSSGVRNLNEQAGVYISGTSTSTTTQFFSVGKIVSGSATGASDSAGSQRATKSEWMRILPTGHLCIQATSTTGSSNDNIGFTYHVHTTSPYIRIRHEGNGSSFTNHTIFHMLGWNGGLIGEIKQTGSGGVNYYSASDHRLKENVVNVTNAITRLKNLKPKRFNFKVNADATQDGFLAHELQEVIPEAVSGTKDEVVTADSKANNPSLSDMEIGDPVHQGVDERRVVPLLTAALQEAIAKIETLETKVAALESS